MSERCAGCGLAVRGGTQGCREIFEALLARDFTDAAYFRVHRMFVDIYSLQHPEDACSSAKSLAAHLTGLCWFLDHGGSQAVGNKSLRRWLNGASPVKKPNIPTFRGTVTIQDVRDAPNPEAYAQAVQRWGRSTWEAYSPLHALARDWIQQAFGEPRR